MEYLIGERRNLPPASFVLLFRAAPLPLVYFVLQLDLAVFVPLQSELSLQFGNSRSDEFRAR
jgi:hypothetical protein